MESINVKFGAASLAFVAVCAPLALAAQTDQGASLAQANAQVDFEQGVRAYADGQYAEAVALFNRAYALLPEAIFLFNAAKAQAAAAGGDRAGIEAARRTLSRARAQRERPLDTPTSARAEEFNAELVSKLEAIEAAEREAAAERIARREAAEREARARFQMSWPGWVGAGLVVGGGALYALTLAEGTQISQDLDDLGHEGDRARYDAERLRLEDELSAGRTQLYVASGLAIVGVGLLTWDLATRGKTPWGGERPLTMSVGPTGAFVRGEF